jgi:hypothetical protein
VLELSENTVHVRCLYPESVGRQVRLRTDAKKWVYAHVRSDVPWLRIPAPHVSGPQQAVIGFEVDSGQVHGNGTAHEGRLQIAANAGQQLIVRVRVEVEGTPAVRPPPPRPESRKIIELPPLAVPSARGPQPVWFGALVGLALRLLLAGPADVYARVAMAPPGAAPPGSFATWVQAPLVDGQFVRPVVVTTWWVGSVIGFLLLRRRSSQLSDWICGLIAGAVLGLIGSATLACLLPWLDAPPRWLLARMVATGGAAWLATAVWIILAGGWWAMMGAVIGWLLGRRHTEIG